MPNFLTPPPPPQLKLIFGTPHPSFIYLDVTLPPEYNFIYLKYFGHLPLSTCVCLCVFTCIHYIKQVSNMYVSAHVYIITMMVSSV